MPTLTEIHDAQNRGIDSLVAAFKSHLELMVGRAEITVIARLQRDLKTEEGVILRTPANSKLLRRIDDLFLEALNDEGYERLVTAFTGQFAGALPYFQETLHAISQSLKEPLGSVTFTSADKAVFTSLQGDVASAIKAAVDTAATGAMQRSLFSFGGVKFGDLVTLLKEKLGTSVARATVLADTGMTSFYRTVNSRGYAIVEKSNPSLTFRFRYFGPLDARNRVWCKEMETKAKSGETYTRDQIDAMNNGMTPVGTVFTMAGGWACRHAWLMVPLK